MKVFSVAVLTSVALAMAIPDSDINKSLETREDVKPQELSSILEAEALAAESNSILNLPHLGEDIKPKEIMINGDPTPRNNDVEEYPMPQYNSKYGDPWPGTKFIEEELTPRVTAGDNHVNKIEEGSSPDGDEEETKIKEESGSSPDGDEEETKGKEEEIKRKNEEDRMKEEAGQFPVAVGKEAAFVKKVYEQIRAFYRGIGDMNNGLAHDNKFDPKQMSDLKYQYYWIYGQSRELKATRNAVEIWRSVDRLSPDFLNTYSLMQMRCDANQNKFDYCAVFSADQFSGQAQDFTNVFLDLEKEAESAWGASEEVRAPIVKRYEEEERKLRSFTYLERTHWTSGNKEGAEAAYKVALDAYESAYIAFMKSGLI